MSSEITSKEAAEILIHELQCRRTRFGKTITSDGSPVVDDSPCGCNTCKYCGIVDHDEEKVQAAYKKAIEVLAVRSILDL